MTSLRPLFRECRRTRRQVLRLGGGALASAWCAPVHAQTPVDLQLVLAVDASGSVDQRRFDLQKQGYVAAFRNPKVMNAIRSGPGRSIANNSSSSLRRQR